MNETDVSQAQQFDVGSFLTTLVGVGGSLAAQKIAASQNTGQPAASTQPDLRASFNRNTAPANNVAGMSTQTITTLGIVAAVAVAAVFLLRK
jgi:hypothetical protein